MKKSQQVKFKIAVGSDHAGFSVKTGLVKQLTAQGYNVVDFGTHTEDSADYPDFAARVAKSVSAGQCDRGVLVCGSGIGMAIAANKVPKIRAAAAWSVTTAKLAAQHNWANVLCVPGRFVSMATAKKMVRAWLNQPFEKGGRHERRIKKILKIESK